MYRIDGGRESAGMGRSNSLRCGRNIGCIYRKYLVVLSYPFFPRPTERRWIFDERKALGEKKGGSRVLPLCRFTAHPVSLYDCPCEAPYRYRISRYCKSNLYNSARRLRFLRESSPQNGSLRRCKKNVLSLGAQLSWKFVYRWGAAYDWSMQTFEESKSRNLPSYVKHHAYIYMKIGHLVIIISFHGMISYIHSAIYTLSKSRLETHTDSHDITRNV